MLKISHISKVDFFKHEPLKIRSATFSIKKKKKKKKKTLNYPLKRAYKIHIPIIFHALLTRDSRAFTRYNPIHPHIRASNPAKVSSFSHMCGDNISHSVAHSLARLLINYAHHFYDDEVEIRAIIQQHKHIIHIYR